MKVNKFQRGQIWWYENNQNYEGSVQGGKRPVVIISNNKANTNSNNITIVPCTTQIKRIDMLTHIQFTMNNEDNMFLCENIQTINKDKLSDYIGTCDKELLKQLEKGVQIALGLNDILQETSKQDNTIVKNTKLEENLDIKKSLGRKPKYNLEDMKRFVNDYNNHTVEYMIKKYNEVSEKAVQNKVYRFRKIIGEGK